MWVFAHHFLSDALCAIPYKQEAARYSVDDLDERVAALDPSVELLRLDASMECQPWIAVLDAFQGVWLPIHNYEAILDLCLNYHLCFCGVGAGCLDASELDVQVFYFRGQSIVALL